MKKNYDIMEIGTFKEDLASKKRIESKEILSLTGSEVTFNYTPAGKYVPFVHSHKLNEEVYIILKGKGMFMVDDEEFPIQEGSVIRVSPSAKRAIAAGDEDLIHICIQAKKESLTQYTAEDGVMHLEFKASWMKD